MDGFIGFILVIFCISVFLKLIGKIFSFLFEQRTCEICGKEFTNRMQICKVRINRIKHIICKNCKNKIERKKSNIRFNDFISQLEGISQLKRINTQQRSRSIPSDVKREVWRRDNGKCVRCGSNKNLEYDHIIPFSKGGSNTVRNIQLLCEFCNRSKNNKII